tara:strand:+ start:815 stop:1096 length:282 start_codon:yes stop_codon:yes gene_type:complete
VVLQTQQVLVLKVVGVNEERNYLRKEERTKNKQRNVKEGLRGEGLNIASVMTVGVIRVNVPRKNLRKRPRKQERERIFILSENHYMKISIAGD